MKTITDKDIKVGMKFIYDLKDSVNRTGKIIELASNKRCVVNFRGSIISQTIEYKNTYYLYNVVHWINNGTFKLICPIDDGLVCKKEKIK